MMVYSWNSSEISLKLYLSHGRTLTPEAEILTLTLMEAHLY